MSDASNLTLLGQAELNGVSVPCIYKPTRGERPLWDFPDGTLAEREYASYLISAAAGWHCVPLTLLRPGPFGSGMVQQWIPDADPDDIVDLVPAGRMPAGWLPVLRARDNDGDPVVLAHADVDGLALLAGFDLVVNNADRKGAHILPLPDGRVLGVDHGLCLHHEDKLRTILWGWAGRDLPEPVLAGVHALREQLTGELGRELDGLITRGEKRALGRRLAALVDNPVFPHAPQNRSPIPWPPL
ncbi:SCO1664 family protein [Nakamurella flavida]|uniref:SCO1664 family protein n=2 Tax=Nakamurella flavida TaxID=363630 RepID=A0A938YCQ6_9ACTN|nr:SCO1664 family protein [Nakamurella flavida]MBM9475251.1 SCO1664 family protein [Nakamurella flavida]